MDQLPAFSASGSAALGEIYKALENSQLFHNPRSRKVLPVETNATSPQLLSVISDFTSFDSLFLLHLQVLQNTGVAGQSHLRWNREHDRGTDLSLWLTLGKHKLWAWPQRPEQFHGIIMKNTLLTLSEEFLGGSGNHPLSLLAWPGHSTFPHPNVLPTFPQTPKTIMWASPGLLCLPTRYLFCLFCLRTGWHGYPHILGRLCWQRPVVVPAPSGSRTLV